MTAPQIRLSVPGPRPFPVFGRSLHVYRFGQDSIGYTKRLFQTYGSIAALAFGGKTNVYSPLPKCPGTVFVYGPELIRQVTTQHEVYYKYPLSGRLYRRRNISDRTQPIGHFGAGLFALNTGQHLQHRKLMQPAFHKTRLDQYRHDMVTITDDVLKQLPTNQPCEISVLMRQLTLRIATKTLFGEDIGASYSTGQLLQDAFQIQGAPLTNLFPVDLPGFPYHRYLNLIGHFEERMRRTIAHKKQEDTDVLSLLIQARDEEGAGLSETELLGHAGVLFAAGHETSANALTWTLFLLSQHPQVAADLLDELQSVLHGEAPTTEQLMQLPLLERVIKESMRVLSPVPWNGRVTSQETELGGFLLPAGTEVFASIYHTHHMNELYADPEAFRPQRWETIHPNGYEYNPFSAGPRVCIGAGFAMMEIKIVLAMLLQRFRLQLLPQHRIERTGVIVLMPKYGMPMQIHSQDRQFTEGVGGVRGNVREMVQLP